METFNEIKFSVKIIKRYSVFKKWVRRHFLNFCPQCALFMSIFIFLKRYHKFLNQHKYGTLKQCDV